MRSLLQGTYILVRQVVTTKPEKPSNSVRNSECEGVTWQEILEGGRKDFPHEVKLKLKTGGF